MSKTNTETVDNIYKKLEATEEQVLKKINKAGYLNPYDEFPKAMRIGDNKRYIKDFVLVDYSDIEENQCAVNIVCEIRCSEELGPLIEKQGLQNPPLVTESSTPGKYTLVTGHHRAYTMNMLGESVPCIVVTNNYNMSGKPVPADIDLLQGIQSNPAQKNRTYSMADAVLMVQQSMKLNPTQNGLNPSGKLPPRSSVAEYDFDDLMNRLYGTDFFPHASPRTKIYNKVLKGKTVHKLIDMRNFSEQTAHLARIGYDTGVYIGRKGTEKRYGAGEHIDQKRGSLIVMTDDNGRNLEGKLFNSIMKRCLLDSDFRENIKAANIKYIDIVTRIHNPPVNLVNLNNRRSTAKKDIKEWANILFPHFKIGLKIREIAFPKQLKVAEDKDLIVKL